MNQRSRFSGGCYIYTLVLEVLILMPDKTGKHLKYVLLSVQYHWPKKISGVHLPDSAVWNI
jgi:hypothetical protein